MRTRKPKYQTFITNYIINNIIITTYEKLLLSFPSPPKNYNENPTQDTPTRMARMKRTGTPNVSKNGKKSEFSSIFSGNVNWYHYLGKLMVFTKYINPKTQQLDSSVCIQPK